MRSLEDDRVEQQPPGKGSALQVLRSLGGTPESGGSLFRGDRFKGPVSPSAGF